MQIRYDDISGMTRREFRRKIMIHVRRLSPEYMEDVRDYLGELR